MAPKTNKRSARERSPLEKSWAREINVPIYSLLITVPTREELLSGLKLPVIRTKFWIWHAAGTWTDFRGAACGRKWHQSLFVWVDRRLQTLTNTLSEPNLKRTGLLWKTIKLLSPSNSSIWVLSATVTKTPKWNSRFILRTLKVRSLTWNCQ